MGGGGTRCIRCFSRTSSANGIAFRAEILVRRWFGDRKNSKTTRCFALFFRCFPPISRAALPTSGSAKGRRDLHAPRHHKRQKLSN
jgi:hypothetical protein